MDFVLTFSQDSLNTLVSILTIASISVGGILGLVKYRPKLIPEPILEYIDSNNDQLVQIKKYNIRWGWGKILFYLIKIQTQPNNFIYKIWYKSSFNSEQQLTKKHYKVSTHNNSSTIYLKDKCLFEKKLCWKCNFRIHMKKCFLMEEDVVTIKIITWSPSNRDYYSKITSAQNANLIEVINDNSIEIRNYEVSLNNSISITQLNTILNELDNFYVDPNGVVTKIWIKTIPPSYGGTSSKVRLII